MDRRVLTVLGLVLVLDQCRAGLVMDGLRTQVSDMIIQLVSFFSCIIFFLEWFTMKAWIVQ
jgi:hypothetical protein